MIKTQQILAPVVASLALLPITMAFAETQPATIAIPGITIRAGSASMGVADTVIFDVSGNDAASNSPVVSTNPINGGVANFTVQFVMETRKPPANGVGRFFGDSSQPLSCLSPTSCGTTTIPFDTISWITRDNDMMELASAFSGAGNQLLHTQTENLLTPALGTRVTDYVEFTFSNSELRPAGTYRGRVNFTGTYP